MACGDDGLNPQTKQTMLQEVEQPLRAQSTTQYYDGIKNDQDLAEAIQNGYITINDEKIFLDFDTSEKKIPENERITIHNGVQIDNEVIENAKKQETLELELVFDETLHNTDQKDYFVKYENEQMYLNESPIKDMDAFSRTLFDDRVRMLKLHREKRLEIINDIKRRKIDVLKAEFDEFADGYAPLKLTIPSKNLFKLTEMDALLGIEMASSAINTEDLDHSSDTFENALRALFVSQVAILNSNNNGSGVGIYMSEDKCPPENWMPNYLRYRSCTADPHCKETSTIHRRTSPNSYTYCNYGSQLPSYNDIGYGIWAPGMSPIMVATLSYGQDPGYYLYKKWDKSADDMINDTRMSIAVSVGNFGESGGPVNSPAKGLNVVAVGGYSHYGLDGNTLLQPKMRNSSSYTAPANTRNTKPEVAAPGYLSTLTLMNNTVVEGLQGTSYSAPFVAGMMANFASNYIGYGYFPAMMKAITLLGATEQIINSDYGATAGVGGAYFHKMFYPTQLMTYDTASFDIADGYDQYPNNNYVDLAYYIPGAMHRARVAISWVTSGSWTYAHRNDAYPIGNSYVLRVLDPNGTVIAQTYSLYNNYCVLEFLRNTPGIYRIQIGKILNYDTSRRFKMGVAVYY